MRRFWKQDSTRYRNFQLVFTVLTLNFAIPTLTYIFSPEIAQEQFAALNLWLGGEPYTFPEAQSRFWRYLGAANVATLALMCGLLQWDLRRNFAVLVPLAFMKSLAATLWLAGFIATPQYPAFAAAAVLDFTSSAAFVYFATRAWRSIDGLSDERLVPRPGPFRSMNRDAANLVLHTVLPSDVPLEPLVRDELGGRNARKLAAGFFLAVWTLMFAPLLSRFHRPLWRLNDNQRDAFISSLYASPVWILRQLVEVVKVVASFAEERR